MDSTTKCESAAGFAARVSEPAVSEPIAFSLGMMVAPDSTVTSPVIMPRPVRVAVFLMVTEPAPVAEPLVLFTTSVPPLTVVADVPRRVVPVVLLNSTTPAPMMTLVGLKTPPITMRPALTPSVFMLTVPPVELFRTFCVTALRNSSLRPVFTLKDAATPPVAR